MNEEKDLEILHISHRKSEPDNDYEWLYVNVVFKIYDETSRSVCFGRVDPWKQSFLYEVEEPSIIDKFYESRTMKFEPIPGTELSKLVEESVDPQYDIRPYKRRGWMYNDSYLQHVKQFDVFCFKEYVEDNLVTRAALQMLQDLKDTGESASRFVPFSTLSRCLETLHTFWD
jgi:hypothetical protein